MSDQTKPDESNSAEDLKNVKAEFNRKLTNIETNLKQSNDALMTQLQQIAVAYQSQQKPKQEEVDKTLETLYYDNPTAYAQKVAERAANEAEARAQKQIDSFRAQEVKRSELLNKLIAEYPELANSSHELTQKAIETYNSLPEEERNSPVAYRLAVKEAASDLGIRPKAKRKESEEEEDGFVFQSSGYTSKKEGKKGRVDARTADFAKLMGIDISKDDVKKKIEEYSQISPQDWVKSKKR